MKIQKKPKNLYKKADLKTLPFLNFYKSNFLQQGLSCSLILILLISSCSDSESPMTEATPEVPEAPAIIQPTVLVIDSTDIKDLPADKGGKHTAYPLASTNSVFGHFVYTPDGYTEDGPEYPLLVFLHGWDITEYTGTDEEELNELLLGTTPPGLIHSGRWKPSTPFIVASPKLKSDWYWRHDQIHEFIKYLIDTYRVNSKRIYLTGLSLGGGGAWYYVGERGEDNYVAAIVPISARGEERIVSNLTNTPIWAFHGDSDATVPAYDNFGSFPLVTAINALNPEIKAKVTIFNNTGHDAWSRVYSNQLAFTQIHGSTFDVSIYDWLLQFKKE